MRFEYLAANIFLVCLLRGEPEHAVVELAVQFFEKILNHWSRFRWTTITRYCRNVNLIPSGTGLNRNTCSVSAELPHGLRSTFW